PRFIETLARRGYRFIATNGEAESAAAPEPGMCLVGREAPLAQLEEALALALQGRRQVVFVSGEAGVGHSALVEAFGGRARGAVAELVVARGQCVEGFGGKEPYYPVLDALTAYCREHPEDSAVREILSANGPSTLRMLRDAIESIVARHPMLLVL